MTHCKKSLKQQRDVPTNNINTLQVTGSCTHDLFSLAYLINPALLASDKIN